MNITQQNSDALNAVLTIELEKADFQPKVDQAIKNTAKKVAIKGFRPGHAPFGMVKKMYGTQILVDELNKLVGETLTNYIKENKIDILGEPLPNEDQETLDLDKELEKATFKFDLGIAPDFEVNLESLAVDSYEIQVADEDVEQTIRNAQQRFGTQEPVEAATEKSLLKGKVSVDGNVVNENGYLSLQLIKDEAEKAKFVGKKVGETVVFDAKKSLNADHDVAVLFGVNDEEVSNYKQDSVSFEISSVSEFKDAEVNEELFEKMFPNAGVKDVDTLKTKILENYAESNKLAEFYRLAYDVRKAMMAQVGELQLPEAFLKRWLTAINKENEKFSPEILESEFPAFKEDLTWQVIKNRVSSKNDIKIEYQDVVNEAKLDAKAQFMNYGIHSVPDEALNNYALRMMKDDSQRQRLASSAIEAKLVEVVRGKATLNKKAISLADFNKMVNATQA